MSYVIYHKDTTQIAAKSAKGYRRDAIYKTMSAAKAALTRMDKDMPGSVFEYAIAELGYYYANIEKQVEKINMMSGKKYMESVNTPNYMSPASEAYWSM